MDKKINLIPIEMAVPARAVRIEKVLNKLILITFIVLISAFIITASFFYYYSNENSKLNKNIESSKLKISDLEKSEQKLILTKDRLSKIGLVQKTKSVNNEVKRYQKFSSTVSASEGSSIITADLTTKGSEISVLTHNSVSLAKILSPLYTLLEYSKVILTSLEYNPITGFSLNTKLKIE